MEESTVSFRQLAAASKECARRLLTIGENRLELLTVEVQEERERLLRAFLLALGVAAFGLLAGHDADGRHCGFVVGSLAGGGSPDLDGTLRSRRGISLPAADRPAA